MAAKRRKKGTKNQSTGVGNFFAFLCGHLYSACMDELSTLCARVGEIDELQMDQMSVTSSVKR